MTKAFATLEDLGFIIRKSGSLGITPKMAEFGRNPDQRVQLFAEAAMGMHAFATFMSILEENKSSTASLSAES